MSLEPLGQSADLPSPTSRSEGVLEGLFDIVPINLICGITQKSFTHLQYFFYAATIISAIVWVFVPISGYLPITLLVISAILFGYPQSISSVEDRRPSIPEMILPTAERYGTYNILCPTYLSNSPSFLTVESRSWEYRKGQVIQNIKEARLDVLGIQEITPVIFAELQQSLADTPLVGEYKGHGTEGEHLKDDGIAVFYNTHKFELLQRGHILSDVTQRICLHVDLRNRENGHVTRFATFHLNGNPRTPKTGNQQLNNILNILTSPDQPAVDRYVLAADFNADMASERPTHRKALIQRRGYYRIACSDETEVGTGARLDDVFVKETGSDSKPALRPLGIHNQPAGSDHRLTGCHVDPI